MDKEIKLIDNKNLEIVCNDNEFDFLEYQETVNKSKEAKRNRKILTILALAIYFIGLGIISGITINLYNIYTWAGIGVGSVLFIFFTIAFFCMIKFIKKKQGFDLEFKKHSNNIFSEKKNNMVRWEIAKNICEQSVACQSLYNTNLDCTNFNNIKELVDNVGNRTPSYLSKNSKTLANNLAAMMEKNGQIYKTCEKMIWKESVKCGTLTAISQSAALDAGIVIVKNLQLIKNIIWLYGFRPTDFEMNRIAIRVIKNVCLSIGLNTVPTNGVTVASKLLSKDSSNFVVQMLGSAFNLGAQFLGNGVMTFLIGKHTVSVMLKEYRLQDVFRKQIEDDSLFEVQTDQALIKQLNSEIKEQIKDGNIEKKSN